MFHRFISVLMAVCMVVGYSVQAAQHHQKRQVKIIKHSGEASLGVVIQKVDAETLAMHKLTGGAEIIEVIEGSEAERIGLKKRDIMVKFDGKEISKPEQLKDLVSQLSEEKQVELVVVRDGENLKFQAKLQPFEPKDLSVDLDGSDFDIDLEKFHEFPHMPPGKMAFGKMKGGFLGVKARGLSDQLLKYFDVPHGVLIEEIIEDSPAARAGFQAGDVLLEIEGKKLEDYSDLVRTLNYYDPGQSVKIKFSRKGKIKTQAVVLEKKKASAMEMEGMDDEKGLKILNPPHLPDPHIESENIEEMEKDLQKFKKVKINIEMFII